MSKSLTVHFVHNPKHSQAEFSKECTHLTCNILAPSALDVLKALQIYPLPPLLFLKLLNARIAEAMLSDPWLYQVVKKGKCTRHLRKRSLDGAPKSKRCIV
ncbi:hypothetical protein FKM82_007175 [Ascaphus truei]